MRRSPLAPVLHRQLDPRRWTTTDQLVALAVLAALIAPVIAVVRAISQDWAPSGDDATIALRAADILDGRLPITGMRSTSGDGIDVNLSTHHLGPLHFYLLALPLALTGGASAGIAIGGGVIAAITSALSVVWARRLGGALGVVVFTAGLLLTQWAIGPEAIFRPLNPYAPLLPTYLALILLWAIARGDHRALPPFVVAVSLIAQGNLAFVPLALALTAGAAGILLWPRLRRTARLTGRPRRRSRTLRRLHGWSIGFGLAAWLPVIAELFAHNPNNLQQLVKWATSGTGSPIGLGAGLQHLSLIAPTPGGFRRSSEELLTQGSTLGTAVGFLLLLLLATISSGWRIPQGRASSASPARIALLANLAMIATASRLPEWPAAPYWIVTWLPVAAFTWAALVWRGLAYLENATPHLAPRLARPLSAALVVGGVAASALALSPNWAESRTMTATARAAVDDLGPGDGRHVGITGLGFTPTLGAGPAVAWRAHQAGWRPHYLTSWPFPEDDRHLWLESAPEGSDQLFITTSNEPELIKGMSATAHLVTQVEMEHRDGKLGVYRDPGH